MSTSTPLLDGGVGRGSNRRRAITTDPNADVYTSREKVWVSLLRKGETNSQDGLSGRAKSRSSAARVRRASAQRFAAGGGGGGGGGGDYNGTPYDDGATTEPDTDGDQEADMLDDVDNAAPLTGNNHIDHEDDSGGDGDGDDDDDDDDSYLAHRVSVDEEHGGHAGDDHSEAHGHGHGHGHGHKLRYLNRIGEIQETHDPLYFDSAIEVLEDQRFHSVHYSQRRCWRWLLLFLVAIGVGISAFIITWITRLLNYARFQLIMEPLAAQNELVFAYLSYTAATCLFGLGAVMCVALGSPAASGSGIPEIITILNGVKVPKAMQALTWLMKVIGVSLSGAAGLPIGREGPMIHSGAIVGAVVSQGKTRFCGINNFYTKYLSAFRNDQAKREFITCGAAGGVAAAFGAPIGGVLFVLEEGASWWYSSLTYRTVLVSVAALLFSTLFNTGINDAGLPNASDFGDFFYNPGIFVVEEKNIVQSQALYYRLWELPIFACMGVAGGILGGIFNFANEALFRWRIKRIFPSKCGRILEGVVVTFIVATVSFAGGLIGMGDCKLVPPIMNATMPTALHQFNCPDGQYNEWASLFLTPLETGIKLLLYFEENANYPDYNASDTGKYFAPGSHTFSPVLLAVFGTVFFALTCLTAGVSVPSSPFIPSLFAGAAYGRLIGQWIAAIVGNMGYVNPGVYALVGAASLLGGVVRMVFCLAVIMIETTNFYQGIVPILIALLACRWSGNHFNDSLYHIYMHLQHTPVLDWTPPKWYNRLQAHHVMTKQVVNIRTFERAGRLLDLLRTTDFNGFPVVQFHANGSRIGDAEMAAAVEEAKKKGSKTPRRRHLGRYDVQGLLRGIILRKQLLVMLSDEFKGRVLRRRRPAADNEGHQGVFQAAIDANALPLRDFEKTYPRYPTVDSLSLTMEERRMWVDLRPYMGIAHTIQKHSSLPRAYHIFRSLGLRHLIVVNDTYDVAGMITRTRVAPHSVEEVHEEFEEQIAILSGKSEAFRAGLHASSSVRRRGRSGSRSRHRKESEVRGLQSEAEDTFDEEGFSSMESTASVGGNRRKRPKSYTRAMGGAISKFFKHKRKPKRSVGAASADGNIN